MKWVDYRERLGIGFNDDAKTKMLANKVSAFIEHGRFNQDYSFSEYYSFCVMTGRQFQNIYPASKYLADLMCQKNNTIPIIISYYIAYVNTRELKDQHQRKLLIHVLSNFLDDLNIKYELLEDADGYFIFPKGVPDFDKALVSYPLEWLREYPQSQKAWGKALRDYAEASDDNASDVADKFRKTLETFFQEFFGGNKSLENYKAEYGNCLKKNGVPKEISGNFETLLQAYTNYMNNYAKHRDATSDKILEYLMYQTGNIIRLLITLKQGEIDHAD